MKKKSLNAKKQTLSSDLLKYLKNKKISKIFNEFKVSLNINNSFAVAVSGGSDSLALAFLSKCFSLIYKTEFKYFIVDHRLRKESSSEAKMVFSILKKKLINSKILIWKGKKPVKNIQAIARQKRYLLLTQECKKNKIKHILFGHHNDDLYENFLIRLLRGSGLKGLTSFGKNSEYKKNDINILRPLINIKKKDLLFISKKVFNFYVEDPSNFNEKYKRIRIRKIIKLLEIEGLDKQKLELTINNLKDSDQSIKFYIKKNIRKNSKFNKKKDILFLNKSFFNQPHEIIFRSLSYLLVQVSNREYQARGKSIDELISKIKLGGLKKVTLGGCFIEKVNQTILISRENQA